MNRPPAFVSQNEALYFRPAPRIILHCVVPLDSKESWVPVSSVPVQDGFHVVLAEIATFKKDCEQRYRFNSRWDNVLNAAGILLSVAIIAAGTFKKFELTTILGGLVAAIVTAQRAFPFGSRAQFYRVLIGQSTNLLTDVNMGSTVAGVVATLKSLRLDFAQQLPRGTSDRADSPQLTWHSLMTRANRLSLQPGGLLPG